LVEHNVDHVLDVLKALGLEVVEDLADELLLSPDEEHAFFHHVRRNHQFLQLLDPQSSVGLPFLFKVVLSGLLRLQGGLGLSILLYAAGCLLRVL